LNRDTNVTAVTEVQVGKGPARDTVLLGKYRVESTLGFGGMGLVIKAHNLALDEYVAIKLLREDVDLDGDNVARFVREAKNAVKLKSEHVARIRDVGTFEDGRPYMVMEMLEGLDLGKVLIDHGQLERARAVDLVLQACDAIAEAHALGIVHRDIKPTNLFVTKRRDGTDLLKVLDFGISKAQTPDMSLTQTQSMLGTPAYMSPEQMRSARTVDPRSDIWSLGCVLYELCEGKPPFDASNFAELCVMVSIEAFAPMTQAPELTRIIDQALAKTVDARFQDVADLAFALEPYASDQERAYRQVTRIFRMLGRTHPDSRDSTPIPLTPRPATSPISSRGIQSSVNNPVLPAAPSSTYVIERGGAWKTFMLLGVLFGVGIGVGLLFLGGEEEDPPKQPAAGGILESGSAGEPVHEMTVERDASIEVATEDAGTLAGSGSATNVSATQIPDKPLVKKPPVRRPPVKKPKPPPKPPAITTSPPKPPTPPKPPPKPKCDPFDNPKGCD
jgi:eukaryotic-like serine/threonine-protein kinase